MSIHAASACKSERLIKTLTVLADGKEHTTRELFEKTGSMAPHTDIAELRANGYSIPPARFAGRTESGRAVYVYQWQAGQMNMFGPEDHRRAA